MTLCMSCKYMDDCPITDYGANLNDALIIALSEYGDLWGGLDDLLEFIKGKVIEVSEVESSFTLGVAIIDCEGYEPRS